MGIPEQMENFLGHVERNIIDFRDRFARKRIDILLSTLELLGIRESLPKEHADFVLADLREFEVIEDEEDIISR